MDYEPSPIVKPHTLDQRLIDTLNFQQMYDTHQKLTLCDELLSVVKSGKTLSMDDSNHMKALQVLVFSNLKKLRDWFKRNAQVVE